MFRNAEKYTQKEVDVYFIPIENPRFPISEVPCGCPHFIPILENLLSCKIKKNMFSNFKCLEFSISSIKTSILIFAHIVFQSIYFELMVSCLDQGSNYLD